MHSTNYTNTLILPSEDCKADCATEPPKPESVAAQQYTRLASTPYGETSDDLISRVQATRREIPAEAYADFRAEYFSKGQACLRASPLVKSFGWALHHDGNACIALIDPASAEFDRLLGDDGIKKVHGMRSKR